MTRVVSRTEIQTVQLKIYYLFHFLFNNFVWVIAVSSPLIIVLAHLPILHSPYARMGVAIHDVFV